MVNAVPLVPRETTTSPGSSSSPIAPAALSPAPGATSAPYGVRPAASAGFSTDGEGDVPAGDLADQVGQVGVARGVEVAGARGVGAVGDQVPAAAQQPAGQPVVRQGDLGGAREVVRLVLGHPRQLADGDRGQRHDAGLPRPPVGALVGHQAGGLGSAAHVVPEQRRPHRLAVRVEGDQAVLLAGDRDGGAVLEGVARRLVQRRAPRPRVHLGAVRMGRRPARERLAGGGVDRHHLAGLGGGVDADDDV